MKRNLFWFVLIGCFGFVVDATALSLLVWEGFNVYIARTASFTFASAVTWALNRSLNFGTGRLRQGGGEYAKYMLVQVLAATGNMSIYALTIWRWPILRGWPIVPLAIGAVVGMMINYSLSRSWVFKLEIK